MVSGRNGARPSAPTTVDCFCPFHRPLGGRACSVPCWRYCRAAGQTFGSNEMWQIKCGCRNFRAHGAVTGAEVDKAGSAERVLPGEQK